MSEYDEHFGGQPGWRGLDLDRPYSGAERIAGIRELLEFDDDWRRRLDLVARELSAAAPTFAGRDIKLVKLHVGEQLTLCFREKLPFVASLAKFAPGPAEAWPEWIRRLDAAEEAAPLRGYVGQLQVRMLTRL
jgi:hypothetical protein